jgi:hypothetical protein
VEREGGAAFWISAVSQGLDTLLGKNMTPQRRDNTIPRSEWGLSILFYWDYTVRLEPRTQLRQRSVKI